MGNIVWTPAPAVFDVRHVLMEIYGDTDTGRTTFGFTMPDPICYIGFGEKTRGVVEQAVRRGKRIVYVECAVDFRGKSRKETKELARASEERMFDHLYDAFDNTWCRSVLLDTHTEAWSVSRHAEFGGTRPDKGRTDRNYEEINARWRNMLIAARASKKNVGLIGMTEAEWIPGPNGNDKKSGRTVRATCYNQLQIKADVHLRTYSAMKTDGSLGKNFASQIEKAWMNAEVAGTVLQNQMSNFPTVMSLITGTDIREWS